MALPDFLGNIGNAMGGNPMGQQPSPFDPVQIDPTQPLSGLAGIFGGERVADAPQQPQQAPQEHHSKLRDFLGNLGDALLVGSGAQPIYGPAKAQRALGGELAAYLGINDPNLVALMQRDPETGFKLWTAQHPETKPQSPTALMQNMEYLHKLNPRLTPDQLANVAQYAIAAPRMYGSPETGFSPDPNYPFLPGGEQEGGQPGELPRVSTPEEAAQLAPGTQFLLPDGRIGTVPGGGAGNSVGGF